MNLSKLLPILSLSALPVAAQAQFDYSTNGSTITLTGYTGSGGAVTISNFVTGIGDGAFSQSSLTSVTIPDSVTDIGTNSFAYCASLANVTMGHGVTSIESNAFGFCNSLTSVTIPDSVTSIGVGAFAWTGLASVTIPGSVTSIGYYAFGSCTALQAINVASNNSAYTSVGGTLFN